MPSKAARGRPLAIRLVAATSKARRRAVDFDGLAGLDATWSPRRTFVLIGTTAGSWYARQDARINGEPALFRRRQRGLEICGRDRQVDSTVKRPAP